MSSVYDKDKNIQKIIPLIRQAQAQGAQIVAMSELTLGSYFCQDNNPTHFNLAEAVPGPTTEVFSALAKELGIVIVASIYERDGDDLYNTTCVLDADGKYLGKYRKLHIPDDLEHHYSEKFYFKPGNLGVPVFKTRFGNIATLICWDQWYPEPARAAAAKGADIIFYPTAIGWQLSEKGNDIGTTEFDAWTTIQRSHAIANGVFVASINRTGLEENIDFWGGSFICGPLGKVLANAGHHEEKIITATIDISQSHETRKSWPFLDCRRPDACK